MFGHGLFCSEVTTTIELCIAMRQHRRRSHGSAPRLSVTWILNTGSLPLIVDTTYAWLCVASSLANVMSSLTCLCRLDVTHLPLRLYEGNSENLRCCMLLMLSRNHGILPLPSTRRSGLHTQNPQFLGMPLISFSFTLLRRYWTTRQSALYQILCIWRCCNSLTWRPLL